MHALDKESYIESMCSNERCILKYKDFKKKNCGLPIYHILMHAISQISVFRGRDGNEFGPVLKIDVELIYKFIFFLISKLLQHLCIHPSRVNKI